MHSSRRFLYETPMIGNGVFHSLGQTAPAPVVVQAPAAAPAPAATPASPVVVQAPASPAPVVVQAPATPTQASMTDQVLSLALVGGIVLAALEITGVTHFTDLRRSLRAR